MAAYERFGNEFVRRVLHRERVLRTVDRLLGDRIELGPIGAGPGRTFTVRIVGHYRPTTGEEVPGALLTYRVLLPIDVVFDLDLRMDKQRFTADVVVPLTLTVHVDPPLTLRWEIDVPGDDEVALTLAAETRRGSVLQRVAGIEADLRRFIVRVVATELAKPYVRRATHIDMERLLDGTWDDIAATFLPAGPEDRRA
ncbi:hypothetical protein [Nocardioides sp. TF02-7]|uniref:hypothetical protein n=1 Tax=Nocardioides sp. TF02-7 TaxID=2917724 RepID=UPI001F0534D2|nr:hypothetical protein [Nocardioides sp. TF02-7]UMG94256.1 hypothetical protein MF408_09690 [Nocardioides sp. TF02-7]